MLEKVVPLIVCPVCRNQNTRLTPHVFARSHGERIRQGALACPACSAWFPIHDHILELTPAALIAAQSTAALQGAHAAALAAAGLTPDRLGRRPGGDGAVDFSMQLAQRTHFDWYADNPGADYADYAEMPFWKAVDAITFRRWAHLVPKQGWLLDVGCANGRRAFHLVGENRIVVGFDISRAMIRKAIQRAEKEGVADRTTFFVSDGLLLPFRDGVLDGVQTYGVLHHLPDPGGAIRDIQRTFKPGGIHFGSENNKTAFRGIFDFLMKLLPIWKEEAGEEPLISREMLDAWTKGLKVAMTAATSVFLPPHLFNLMGTGIATKMVSFTDALFSGIPWIGRNGGLIVFEIKKLPANGT